MRVPSPVELTCADPNAPCTLPNIFVADPPLQPVRATTYEFGVARPHRRAVRSTAPRSTGPIWPTTSSSSAPAAAPSTRATSETSAARAGRGSSSPAARAIGPLRLIARYSLLDATFQTAFIENSPNNATADADGNIDVQPGNRLPGLPRQHVPAARRLGARAVRARRHVVAVELAIRARQREQRRPGGKVPGYALVGDRRGLAASRRDWQLFARIDNLFNTHVRRTSGSSAPTTFVARATPSTRASPDPSPSGRRAPTFGAWVGIQYRLDRGGGNR